jgi:hypothetical protein
MRSICYLLLASAMSLTNELCKAAEETGVIAPMQGHHRSAELRAR